MPDESGLRELPRKRSSLPAKFLTISIGGMLLGMGLCGVGTGLEKYEKVSEFFEMAGSACFGISMWAALLCGLIWFIMRLLKKGHG